MEEDDMRDAGGRDGGGLDGRRLWREVRCCRRAVFNF